ncbi:MAG: glycosyltransferase family 39 protein [Bacteroidales bacterium]|nr:glycosyltransferase family 39 protein [Bacteroidales bacterium]
MKSLQRFTHQLEAWLTKRHLIIVGIIILISLIFRIIYFNQISHSPLINFHQWSESDMNFFNTWRVYLAEEDWLADTSLHPHHSWHQEIAELYFQKHEAEYQTYLDSLQNSNSVLSPEQLLLNRWFGEKKYHQEPLYAYTLAATYAIGGKNIKIVYTWQMILGIFSIVLIYLITRRYFGEIPGLLAAFIATFYGPMLFYEGVLLRTTAVTFSGLLLIYLFDKALTVTNLKRWFILGIISGAIVLLKGPFLIFIIGVPVVTFFYHYQNKKSTIFPALIFFAGVLLTLLPLTIRNINVGASPISFGGVGSISFINANNINSSSTFRLDQKITCDILESTDGKFFQTVIETLKTHKNTGSFLALLWGKFAAIWHWYEIPNNTNFYFYKIYAPVLNVTFITFYFLAPFALIGLFLSLIKKKQPWPLYLIIIVYIVALMGFFVFSRFRLPFIAILIPFSSYALYKGYKYILTSYRHALLFIGITCLLFLWTSRKLPEGTQIYRYADYHVVEEYFYKSYYASLFQQNNNKQAIKQLKDQLARSPNFISNLTGYNIVRYRDEQMIALYYANINYKLAQLYKMEGNEFWATRYMTRSYELQKSSGY